MPTTIFLLSPSLTFVLAAAIFLLSPPSSAAAAGDDIAAATTTTGAAAAAGRLGTYLVVVCRANGPKENGEKLREWHASLLASLLNTTTGTVLEDARRPSPPPSGQGQLVYSYQHVVSGFAARLTLSEVDALRKLHWCVDAIPDVNYRLRTTFTPALLGLSSSPPATGMWAAAGSMGEGVIVGVLDNGIDPRHASYSDAGMPPPPAKWRGRCDFAVAGRRAPCNRKLIGGQSSTAGAHGTHTSSTAVGAFVPDVKLFSTAGGGAVASGMAPRAHLAFYEVCFEDTCPSTRQLIAIERGAFTDSVDVISISAGDDTQKPFYQDLTAVGSFSAVTTSGVFVSTSAGNAGPDLGTVTNCAPWVLTVAASTVTRRIVSQITLGNGALVVDGEAGQPYADLDAPAPIVHVEGVFEDGSALRGVDVRGKVVLCDRSEAASVRGEKVRAAGGVGIVFFNDASEGAVTRFSGNVTIAAARVSEADGAKIMAYIKNASSTAATARMHFAGEKLDPAFQPAVADYSSRGPCNMSNLGVLKPDITGPGSSIIAAVPGETNGNESTSSSRTFGLLSGTSMAAPHLSGIAAVLKRARPGWSPSAIKSAMMTTADVTHPSDGSPISDEITGKPAGHLLMGSGIVNPTRALDPGLVYDLAGMDYIPYICGLGYSDDFVNEIIAQPVQNVTCATVGKVEGKDLNYPSFLVTLTQAAGAVVEVRRTVTNVGDAAAAYAAEVVAPPSVAVEVLPPRLEFGAVNQKMEFRVRFSRVAAGAGAVVEGSLRWVSGKKYSVRSPIVVLDGTQNLVK